VRDQAAPEVPPCEQREGDGEQEGGGGERHQERPPALARERARRLAPADRREPRERPVADVARGAQDVRDPEHGGRESVRRAGALRDLGRDRGDGGEHDPGRGERRAEGERARERLADREQRSRHAEADHEVDRGDEGHGGGRRRGPADRRGAHELGPPALLLGPRVAPGEQEAEERDRDGAVRAELERDQAADRVEPAGRAAQGDDRRVVLERRRDPRAVGGGRVQALEARGRREDDEDERDDAAGDQPPVAAGGEPGERDGPGELRHRAAAGSGAAPSGEAPSRSSP
jgi:hypothetical protein